MIMKGSASEFETPASRSMATESFQGQEPVDDGVVPGICDHDANFPCHHLLRLQGSRRHLRTVHGHWCILWPDGGDSGPSSA